MSEKKIVVPEEMLKSAEVAYSAEANHWGYTYVVSREVVEATVEAALRWLSENPILPSDDQCRQLWRAANGAPRGEWPRWVVEVWQRRMLLSPETPEEVKDLLANPWGFDGTYDSNIIEAFRRGQKSR